MASVSRNHVEESDHSNLLIQTTPDRAAKGRIRALLLSALTISFLGSLPLGTVNGTLIQITVTSGNVSALWFAAGGMVAEMIYVRLSLAMMERIIAIEKFMKYVQWISLIVLISLAAASFSAAFRPEPLRSVFVQNTLPPFFFGFLLMAVNPVQIPFWFGWTTVLFARRMITRRTLSNVVYMAGAGLGSGVASVLFVVIGQSLFQTFLISQRVLHLSIGGLFVMTAFWQGVKLFRAPTKS
jgi:threonine/homoserine/homoserine lactone efflux protein